MTRRIRPLTLLEIRQIARRSYTDKALQRKLMRALIAQRGKLLIDGGEYQPTLKVLT